MHNTDYNPLEVNRKTLAFILKPPLKLSITYRFIDLTGKPLKVPSARSSVISVQDNKAMMLFSEGDQLHTYNYRLSF